MQSLEARIADRKKRKQLEAKKREDIGISADGSQEGVDFSTMKKSDLQAYAAKRGIDISEARTNAQIIDAIEAADEGDDEDDLNPATGAGNPWNK